MITIPELLNTFAKQTDYIRSRKANVVSPYFFELKVDDFNANHLRSFLMKRLNEGIKPATVVKEFQVLKASLKLGGFKTKVFKKVPIKNADVKRDRRMTQLDRQALMKTHALRPRESNIIEAVDLAIETAMRRNELSSLTWDMVDFDKRMISLPARITKTKRGRKIPMSSKTIEICRKLQKQKNLTVLNMTNTALGLAWARWKGQASKIYPPIKSLRFHDLRHEAISRLAEKGFTIPEMMCVSGHADQRCLLRYVQLKAEDLLDKFQ
tara:strand:+ start:2161 stop:2961 length:801 start_codon:yes stop_codon:yes gene_type:complete